MGAPAILFTPRGVGDTAARLPPRSSAPYSRTMRYCQLMNWYVCNERAMSNGDPRIFGLPCRFPATPSIFALCRGQAYDRTRFFGMGGAAKIFLPGFSLCGREREGRRYPARLPLLWRRGHRLGSHGPITPRIVAVQPAPLRRRGALSERMPHCATARASFAFAGGPILWHLDQIVARFWCGKARAERVRPVRCRLMDMVSTRRG